MTTQDIRDLTNMNSNNTAIRGMTELFDTSKKGIEIKTHLSDNEIKIIVKLMQINKEFKIKGGDQMIEKFMRLRLSKDRKSRKEILEIIKGEAQTEAKKSIGDFLFNKNKNPMM